MKIKCEDCIPNCEALNVNFGWLDPHSLRPDLKTPVWSLILFHLVALPGHSFTVCLSVLLELSLNEFLFNSVPRPGVLWWWRDEELLVLPWVSFEFIWEVSWTPTLRLSQSLAMTKCSVKSCALFKCEFLFVCIQGCWNMGFDENFREFAEHLQWFIVGV